MMSAFKLELSFTTASSPHCVALPCGATVLDSNAVIQPGDCLRLFVIFASFCIFADTPSPFLLKHLLNVEGGAAEYKSSRRRL